MRIGLRNGRRAAVGLLVAAVGAGVLYSPWGAAVRADVRATIAGTGTIKTPLVAPSASAHRSGRPPVPARPPSDVAQAAVDAAVPPIVAGRPAHSVSIVGIDATSGVSVGWESHAGMPAASVFKLTLLEGYLLQNQERGRSIADGASDVVAAMIENSDNDAADELYAALGGDAGVAGRMHQLGLSSTVLGPHDQWGLSTTTAADQSALLLDLVSPTSPLSAGSRAYALGLMTKVEADQRWGVGAAADPGTTFANKDGWLDVDDDGGRWVVSSVGLVQSGGHRLLLAVLTQHDADFTGGIQLVQTLSRSVATALRGATAPSGQPIAPRSR